MCSCHDKKEWGLAPRVGGVVNVVPVPLQGDQGLAPQATPEGGVGLLCPCCNRRGQGLAPWVNTRGWGGGSCTPVVTGRTRDLPLR